jgi:hypothetical protein
VPLCTIQISRGLVSIEPRVPLEPEDEGNAPSETSGYVIEMSRRRIPEGVGLQVILDAMKCAWCDEVCLVC